LDLNAVQRGVDRRRPGQSELTSARQEADRVQWLSGLFEGKTLGSPLAFLVANKDARSEDYEHLADTFRPSHADYTTEQKYGLRAWAGGGRASARETVARVVAGEVARQVLQSLGDVEIVAWVDRIAEIRAEVDQQTVTLAEVEKSLVRCPDEAATAAMVDCIQQAKASGDTVGGAIRCIARGVPAGLGEPVFDKLEADLAKALMSIPAARSFEIGSGLAGTSMKGSQHNDRFVKSADGTLRTQTNHSGGVQGGISNGMPIVLTVGFKPVSTLQQAQSSVDRAGEEVILEVGGRHDPCVLPRAVPIVEAMVALVLIDHWLRWRGQVGG